MANVAAPDGPSSRKRSSADMGDRRDVIGSPGRKTPKSTPRTSKDGLLSATPAETGDSRDADGNLPGNIPGNLGGREPSPWDSVRGVGSVHDHGGVHDSGVHDSGVHDSGVRDSALDATSGRPGRGPGEAPAQACTGGVGGVGLSPVRVAEPRDSGAFGGGDDEGWVPLSPDKLSKRGAAALRKILVPRYGLEDEGAVFAEFAQPEPADGAADAAAEPEPAAARGGGWLPTATATAGAAPVASVPLAPAAWPAGEQGGMPELASGAEPSPIITDSSHWLPTAEGGEYAGDSGLGVRGPAVDGRRFTVADYRLSRDGGVKPVASLGGRASESPALLVGRDVALEEFREDCRKLLGASGDGKLMARRRTPGMAPLPAHDIRGMADVLALGSDDELMFVRLPEGQDRPAAGFWSRWFRV